MDFLASPKSNAKQKKTPTAAHLMVKNKLSEGKILTEEGINLKNTKDVNIERQQRHFHRMALKMSSEPTRDEMTEEKLAENARKKMHIELFMIRHGILSSDHPLVLYTSSILTKICDDPDIKLEIHEGRGGLSAMATYDKRIILSKEIIELCDTEEELFFVLHHELNHLKEGHFDVPNSMELNLHNFFSRIGRDRLQEVVDGDGKSLSELDKKGINIAGAFTFFEKLIAWEKKNKIKGHDLVHGLTEERLVLLKTQRYLKDFEHYDPQTQTPLPSEIKNEENLKDTYGFPLWQEMIDMDKRFELRQARIETMNAEELYVLSLDLYGKLVQLENFPGKNVEHYRALYQPLLARMRLLLKEKWEQQYNFSSEHADTLLNFVEEIMRPSLSIVDKPKSLKNKKEESRPPAPEWLERLVALGTALPNTLLTLMPYDHFLLQSKNLDKIMLQYEKFPLKEIERSAIKNIVSFLKNAGVPLKTEMTHENRVYEKTKIETSADQTKESTFSEAEIDKIRHFRRTIGDLMRNKKNNIRPTLLVREYEESVTPIIASKVLAEVLSLISQLFHKAKISVHEVGQLLLSLKSKTYTDFERQCILIVLSDALELMDITASPESKSTIIHLFTELYQNVQQLFTFRFSKAHEDLSRINEKEKCVILLSYTALLKYRTFKEGLAIMKQLRDTFPFTEKTLGTLINEWLYNKFINPNTFKVSPHEKSLTLDDYKKILATFSDPNLLKLYAGVLVSKFRFDFKDDVKDKSPAELIDALNAYETLTSNSNPDNTETNELFYSFLASRKWTLTGLEECYLLLRIANIALDPTRKNILLRKTWERIFVLFEQESKTVAQLLESLPQNVSIPFDIFEILSEEKAETEVDLEACQNYIRSLREKEAAVGKVILVGEFFSKHLLKDKVKVLKAILDPESDRELKEMIWRTYQVTIFGLGGSATLGLTDYAPDHIAKTIFSMDDYQKQSLIHTLLIGDGGILYDPEGIKSIVDYFFEKFLEAPTDEVEASFLQEAKKILKIAIQESKAEDIYFLLSHLLNSRILRPAKKIDWEELASIQALRDEIYEKCAYDEAQTKKCLHKQLYGDEDSKQSKNMKAVAYLFKSSPRSASEKMDSLGLLIEIAQSLGSIGVRFLQLMGMYMDIPSKYQDAFKKVYSGVKGQYKLTAYDTVKSHIPAEKRKNMRIGKRIGGGSIITGYRFDTDDVSGIIKVINPNILAEMNTVFDVLERTFKILIEEDEKKYGPLLSLLYTVKQWILADVKLAGSQQLDRQFAAHNEGVSSPSGKHRSAVPNVHAYHDKYIIEERIEGQTLQYLEASPEDLSDMMALIRQQIFNQILAGIMHSDIHPGNFIVSSTNRIYWLDRTLLLNLSPVEQQLLMNSMMQGEVSEIIKYFVKGLLKFPDNQQNFDEQTQSEIIDNLNTFQGLDMVPRMKAIMVYLRSKKVNIPFNIDMALKNILATEMLESSVLNRKVKPKKLH